MLLFCFVDDFDWQDSLQDKQLSEILDFERDQISPAE